MNDELWRIIGGVIILAFIEAFKPQIMKFMHKIGYRDWK